MNYSRTILTGLLVSCSLLPAKAQTSPFAGDFVVHGGVSINDTANSPILQFGADPGFSSEEGVGGASFTYFDGSSGTMLQSIRRIDGNWSWQIEPNIYADTIPLMMLDNWSGLNLFDVSDSNYTLRLSAGGGSSNPGLYFHTAAGDAALTMQSGLLQFSGATNFSGNATFTGNVHLNGGAFINTNTFALGSFGDVPSIAGIELHYTDGGAGLVAFHGNRWGMAWDWQHDSPTGVVSQMILNPDNVLYLYKMSAGSAHDPGIILNPNGDSNFSNGSIYLSGPQGSPSGGGITFLRLCTNSSTDIGGYSIQNWSGNMWASSRTGVELTAGNPSAAKGINALMDSSSGQTAGEFRVGSYSFSGADIVLYPGQVTALVAKPSGNVGIGTSTPTAKLEVNGDAKFTGVVHVAAGGDIPMFVP